MSYCPHCAELEKERDYFREANTTHERWLLEIEAALGGCRPPLVEGSMIENILAYVAKFKDEAFR